MDMGCTDGLKKKNQAKIKKNKSKYRHRCIVAVWDSNPRGRQGMERMPLRTALVESPELNQMSPPYTVGVTYHVSLEFSVSYPLLHCARGDSKYLCAVAHF
jgi:hypothetical protein